MNLPPPTVRALGLCSGGLDSILAALVLREQGIEVEWVTFETPFFSAQKARRAAQITAIPLTIKNITAPYVEMLKNPPCGYGQHMNPCMDCHALMFRHAGRIMKNKGFDFLFSGEVVGQRPMSQTKSSLRYVEKNSGFDGLIVRPLCAKRLPETIPEKKGLVKREGFLDISGRSRKPQIELAIKLGINDYPAPAGGCLLCDKIFSLRLKDLFKHRENCSERELHLLKYGRHFRLNEKIKIIVGRTQRDNENILKYYHPAADTLLKVKNFPGPITVISQTVNQEAMVTAASICAGYSKSTGAAPVNVSIKTPSGQEIITVDEIPPSDVRHLMI
ncbi:MAG: tRNA 4-thiouridine(8) synthase ThiI [Thermodesulfobacteriota bacterium]|nr:tRNA 4-thiouridine(8) synthase ThiI [Thermodesulfobacteriota bacterium]